LATHKFMDTVEEIVRGDMVALGDAQDRADRALREQELRVLRDLPLVAS